MTKKIFRSILLLASAVLIGCLAIIAGILYPYFTEIQKEQLASKMELASLGLEAGGMDYLEELEADNYRITWVSDRGKVLFDSNATSGKMENHYNRKEIKEAKLKGQGQSERYSTTLSEKTIYLAQRLEDGSYLRISTSQGTVLSLEMGLLQPIIIILIGAVILSALLARRIARRIIKPLNDFDLEKPLDNDAYEELSPMLSKIENQHRLIKSHLNELKELKDEFSMVTDSMNEGLILLNDQGFVLSMNPVARHIFELDKNYEGKYFWEIERGRDISSSIEDAKSGKVKEVQMSRAGREYRVAISPVKKDGETTGVALLLHDVTDKVFAERNRQEFTANVSHELRVPLQSIMGSAELIEKGLVEAENMPRFIGHIRSESEHLMALIEDILRLSRIDEGEVLPLEDVDILEVTHECLDSLSEMRKLKGVEFSIEGQASPIRSIYPLVKESIFNLCENAIKYNRDRGQINISINSVGEGVLFSIEDKGIGIPAEDQSRVFERFYRVDKSRSKGVDGTGLGLSIVKHAVQYLGGNIKLYSKEGKGTQIEVLFPGQ